ncbi:PepSY domain-containing protein [Ruegeria sp. HKCCD7255]|uniref:PepSY-associated TM helix domain-containing protein n=1 Tax=Ruegeria sp. HKCCD7255 TaxID=2683004 RepID=UPI001C2C7BA6|nr:PepSY-associated TM helix domain-containing protein [Ruegeria sp. HKCCD7255]
MSNRKSFRSFLFWLHTWFGLNIVLYLTLIFLSGTVLVLAPEIEALVDSTRRTDAPRAPLPVAAIYDNIRTEWPQARIERIEREASGFVADNTTILTPWGEKALVWTNPQTGEIQGITGKLDFKEILRSFHDSLLTRHVVGTLVVTLAAPIMIILIITGLISYRRFWRGFFRWPKREMNARSYWGGMHRLTALWSLPFLVVVALTSLYYFAAVLSLTPYHYPAAETIEKRQQPLPSSFDGADVLRAVSVAQDEIPTLEPELVILPSFPGQSIVVQGQADAWLVRGRANKVTLDPSNMAVLGAFTAQELGPMTRLREAADSLHFGIWGGMATRILWFAFGVMLTGLAIFGMLVYARRISTALDGPTPNAPTLVWRGMVRLKWLLPLGIVLGLGAGIYGFAFKPDRWARVPAYDAPLQLDGSARLFAKGKLRAGEPLDLRLRLADYEGAEVQILLNGQAAETKQLESVPDWQQTRFQMIADDGDNPVTVQLPDGTKLTWTLGRPVF